MNNNPANGEFLLYQTEDAQSRIQVRLIDGTLWLTQKQLSELYQVSVPTINRHLRVIYEDGELDANRTIRQSVIVADEGKRRVERLVDHYNLEAILHVGYRVRSHRGAQFRRWASEALKSYLEKDFLLDDERFKGGNKSPKPADFANMKGIIVIKGHGWKNAVGHVTLWNGKHCSDTCHLLADPDNGAFVPDTGAIWILP